MFKNKIMMCGIDLTKPTIDEVCCVLVAIIIGVISYFYAMQTNEPLWFSRAGSLMVLFSIMAEYSNYNVQVSINSAVTEGLGTIGGGVGPLKQPKFRKNWSRITHVTAAAGTIIWGYGDLFV